MRYEEVAWDVHPVTGMSRQDRSWMGRPYRAAVTPAIAALDPTPSSRVMAEAEEAAYEIRTFDQEVGHEIAPFAAVLLRTESAASSQIEQLSASARRIAEAEVLGGGSGHAGQIVGNVRAMTTALGLAHRIDADSILAMHHALVGESDPDIAGQWRPDQVWIGGPPRMGAGSPHTAHFVPPVAGRVPSAIDDLVRFAAREDLAVMPQTAVAHAQFETIHPFPDGNGRTGRALMHAMLKGKGLTRTVSVPISSGLLVDTKAYYDALTAYREGDVDPIVSCVSRAALIGVGNGRLLVRELNAIRGDWSDRLSGLRADSAARRLAEGLFAHPVITNVIGRQLLGAQRNEHRHIDALVERGILVVHTDHKTRNRLWRAPDVLAALDRYAARAGRRR